MANKFNRVFNYDGFIGFLLGSSSWEMLCQSGTPHEKRVVVLVAYLVLAVLVGVIRRRAASRNQ